MFRLLILLGLVLATSASAEVGKNQWPMGNHTHSFLHSDGSRVAASGWDPSFDKSLQGILNRIIDAFYDNGHTTFDVGLPDSMEPDSLKRWPVVGSLTEAKLLAIDPNWPKVALEGGHLAYLIHGYTNCTGIGADGCPKLEIGDSGKYAFEKSAFGMLQKINDNAHPMAWTVDTLIHAMNEQPAGLQFEGDWLFLTYTEVLGGDDGCKINENHNFWRTHIHNPQRDGTEHADGCQGSGPSDFYSIATMIQHLFRNSNAALWLPSEGGNAGPVYLYRTLVFGGQSGIRSCEKSGDFDWVGPMVTVESVFGAIDGLSSHRDHFFSDCNGTPAITKRGRDNVKLDGTTEDIDTFIEPTAEDMEKILAKDAQMKLWASQIRTAAGEPNTDPDNNVPPPAPPTPPPAPEAELTPEPPVCQPEGAALECPGHGTEVRCEVPVDAQAVSDRNILLRLYINGDFVDYPPSPHFPLDGKVFTNWAVQPTDDIFWGVCINHLVINPCTIDANGEVQPPGCKQDFTSDPMELGYSYGVPLPEASHGLIFGIGLLYLINRRRKS